MNTNIEQLLIMAKYFLGNDEVVNKKGKIWLFWR